MKKMDDSKLFDGIGIVIDDNVTAKEGDQIVQIVDYLENTKHLPLAKYESLPDISDMNALLAIKFILLDWDLNGLTDDKGLPITNPQLRDTNIKDNVEFLKKIVNSIVVPIFIFSNETIEDIERQLIDNKLIYEENKGKSSIFVKSKTELFKNEQCVMFDVVNAWLRKVPSMYVIQKWKSVYLHAINNMAVDLSKTSNSWPSILWNCYVKDGVNPSEEIASLINQNVLSRIKPVEFDSSILGEYKEYEIDTLRDILTKRCFIDNTFLGKDFSTGDLFKKKRKYYLNVRPECDCVEREGKCELYLLKGRKLKEGEIHGEHFSKYGKFLEQSNTVILGPINNVFLEFRLKELTIADSSGYGVRLGRIIPPFITYITQKFGLYIHRQGLPRLPEEIFSKDGNQETEVDGDEIEELKNKLSDSSKKIQELTSEIKKMKSKDVKTQPMYRLYNCKVNIVPSLKRRKFRK